MHYEVITQTDDGFEFSPPLTHPEAKRFLEVMMEQERPPRHAYAAKVYEMQELFQMGGAA
jgi:hypothetical protein